MSDHQRIAQRHHDGMCDGACPECDRQQRDEQQRDDTEQKVERLESEVVAIFDTHDAEYRERDAALAILTEHVRVLQETAEDVSRAVERVGLGEPGAIGALYLQGNRLRSALASSDSGEGRT